MFLPCGQDIMIALCTIEENDLNPILLFQMFVNCFGNVVAGIGTAYRLDVHGMVAA